MKQSLSVTRVASGGRVQQSLSNTGLASTSGG